MSLMTYFCCTRLPVHTYCSLDPWIPAGRCISPSDIPHCHYSHFDNLQNMDLGSNKNEQNYWIHISNVFRQIW